MRRSILRLAKRPFLLSTSPCFNMRFSSTNLCHLLVSRCRSSRLLYSSGDMSKTPEKKEKQFIRIRIKTIFCIHFKCNIFYLFSLQKPRKYLNNENNWLLCIRWNVISLSLIHHFVVKKTYIYVHIFLSWTYFIGISLPFKDLRLRSMKTRSAGLELQI